MKRIVFLIDGTWNKEGIAGNTNVAALDPGSRIVAHAFIKTTAADGIAQHVHYHSGVGADGDLFKKLLGGAIGLGLKQIIRECYDFVVTDYSVDDEIYLIGFSRGAYAARALAGLIGSPASSDRRLPRRSRPPGSIVGSSRHCGLTQKRQARWSEPPSMTMSPPVRPSTIPVP
jgi:uncharacterized protein (DUF2235 family)